MSTPIRRCKSLPREVKLYLPDVWPLCRPADHTACPPCQQLAQLDGKIRGMREMLTDIENLRQDLNTQMNEHHDRLIHRFPSEISADIFQMYLPTDIMDNDLNSETSKHVLAASLALSAVCRRWRATAQSTPQLWMDIPLRLRTFNLRSLPLLAKDWIDRSGQLPLSINLTVSPARNLAPTLISRMIAVLNQCSTRWLRSKYEGPSSALSYFAGHTSGYSMLRTLRLKAHISRIVGTFNLGTFKI
ncbi:hypothetical protein HYPSUDRAFT_899383 [Hypholoma sublateritium FD-334 SS-4]|uniref:Uncharacterized protein n=1 Tax=Hypholoma sublateritium (strain FD-334 SS-4) TaxID=945553 RepID=A0A0D2PGK8_HYPSF|nr:hypothetical protein HYPSUDRAFT_899383 [Hypholoma sublateritium FD-334 SS-4]